MVTYEGNDRRRKEPWHVGKKFPFAVLLAVLVQTVSLVSWIARFDERTTLRLDDHEKRLTRSELIDDRLTSVQSDMCQRMARIEEKSSIQLEILKDLKDTIKEHDGKVRK